jgi:hypothetical protein
VSSSLFGKTWFWNVESGLMSQKVQVVVCRILDWPLYQHVMTLSHKESNI